MLKIVKLKNKCRVHTERTFFAHNASEQIEQCYFKRITILTSLDNISCYYGEYKNVPATIPANGYQIRRRYLNVEEVTSKVNVIF